MHPSTAWRAGADLPRMRGLAAPARAPLRAGDLRPGNVYLSPSGRKCLLLQPTESGLSRTSYLFAYITRNGKASEGDGFALSTNNAQTIAALREWRP
jgi:hypothetical protein